MPDRPKPPAWTVLESLVVSRHGDKAILLVLHTICEQLDRLLAVVEKDKETTRVEEEWCAGGSVRFSSSSGSSPGSAWSFGSSPGWCGTLSRVGGGKTCDSRPTACRRREGQGDDAHGR